MPMSMLRIQVRAKYNSVMVDVFRETFCWLPLGYVLGRKVLVLHGGLFSRDGVTLDDLRAIDRNRWAVPSYCVERCWSGMWRGVGRAVWVCALGLCSAATACSVGTQVQRQRAAGGGGVPLIRLLRVRG